MDEEYGMETVGPEDSDAIVPAAEPEKDWQAEYAALQKKLGTEDDVNAVKSQRDQIKHQAEQLAARQAEYEATLAQAQQQLQYYMQQQYAAMNPDQQAAWQYQAQQVQAQQYIAQLQAQNAEYQRAIVEAQQRQAVDGIRAAVLQVYGDVAQAAGISLDDLDVSSLGALHKSYTEKVKPILTSRQAPPTPPQVPNRGLPTTAPRIDEWFADAARTKGLNEVERLFDLIAQGVDPRSLPKP